jgi:hypothetical protein
LLDLPGSPEKYRRLALDQTARTSDALASISRNEWNLPTVLPFWRVCDVVGHLYVVAGFFTSATPVVSGPILQWRAARLAAEVFDVARPLVIPSLHYSNIVMPRIAGRFLPQSASVGAVRALLDMLADKLAKIPESRLAQDLPYFRWAVPIHLYIAVIAKELAVHRWEIENATKGADVDPDLGALLPRILWAAAAVYSKPHGGSSRVVQTVEPTRSLTWQFESRRVFPIPPNDHPKADAVISGPSADLALTMMGRISPRRLTISGDRTVAQSFLRAFSYRAGPTPFFNP